MGSFSKKELEKEASRSTKMKMIAEESRQEYQEVTVNNPNFNPIEIGEQYLVPIFLKIFALLHHL